MSAQIELQVDPLTVKSQSNMIIWASLPLIVKIEKCNHTIHIHPMFVPDMFMRDVFCSLP